MGVLVRMMQHRTDPRYDGRQWPPSGGEFEVPEWEADELCRTDPHQSPPMAVRVPGSEKKDTAGAAETQSAREPAADPPPPEPDDENGDSADDTTASASSGTGAPRRGRPPGSSRRQTT